MVKVTTLPLSVATGGVFLILPRILGESSFTEVLFTFHAVTPLVTSHVKFAG